MTLEFFTSFLAQTTVSETRPQSRAEMFSLFFACSSRSGRVGISRAPFERFADNTLVSTGRNRDNFTLACSLSVNRPKAVVRAIGRCTGNLSLCVFPDKGYCRGRFRRSKRYGFSRFGAYGSGDLPDGLFLSETAGARLISGGSRSS